MKAQQKFHSLLQQRGESVNNFYNRYKLELAYLESAGVDPMRDEDQAMSFILKLNANFGRLRTQLLEEKLIKCPKTLAKALKQAREREAVSAGVRSWH
eukprot:gene5912-6510_t